MGTGTGEECAAKSRKFKCLHYTCIPLWGQSVADIKGSPIRRENHCLGGYSLLTFIVKKKFNLFEAVSTSLYPSDRSSLRNSNLDPEAVPDAGFELLGLGWAADPTFLANYR